MHFTFFSWCNVSFISFFFSSSRRRPQLQQITHPFILPSPQAPFLKCTFLIAPHYPFILKLFYAVEAEGKSEVLVISSVLFFQIFFYFFSLLLYLYMKFLLHYYIYSFFFSFFFFTIFLICFWNAL